MSRKMKHTEVLKHGVVYASILTVWLWSAAELEQQKETDEEYAERMDHQALLQMETKKQLDDTEKALLQVQEDFSVWKDALVKENKTLRQTVEKQKQELKEKDELLVQKAEAKKKASQKKAADNWTTFHATAYTPYCAGCSGVTATGINVRQAPNKKIVAVDPSVIPLGSRVEIEGMGEYLAADTGGAIKGRKIDILHPTKQQAYTFGRQDVRVRIIQ